jgi:blue copper oxidase
MGLTGIMIIDDGSDARLDLPRTYGVDDLPIILQDRSIDSDGSIGYDNNDLNPLDIAYGARGDTIVVNGAIAPTAKVPVGLVRLRLLNAANAQKAAHWHRVREKLLPAALLLQHRHNR